MSVTTLNKPEAEAEAEEKGGGKKKLIIMVVAVLLVAGGVWYFMFKPAGAEPPPEKGEVTVMEPIQINLAGGHYLKLGLAVQGTTKAKEAPDGSIALDSAIALFSGRPMDELSQPVQRENLKKELVHKLEERYEEGTVMDVYFTDFVTQ